MTPQQIILRTNAFFGFDIRARVRVREFVYARRMAWRYLRDNTFLSSPEIADLFEMDHSTVLQGLQAHNNDLDFNKDYRNTFAKYTLYMDNDKQLLNVEVPSDVMSALEIMARGKGVTVYGLASKILVEYANISKDEWHFGTDEKHHNEAIKALRRKGKTVTQIAQAVSMTSGQVRHRLIKLGINGESNPN